MFQVRLKTHFKKKRPETLESVCVLFNPKKYLFNKLLILLQELTDLFLSKLELKTPQGVFCNVTKKQGMVSLPLDLNTSVTQ